MAGVGLPIAIRCPRCGAEARMEPHSRWLRGEEARAAAEAGAEGVWDGRSFVVARYPRLISWKHRALRWYNRELWGICRCPACGYLDRHRLCWPADAYWVVSIRGRTLWAWTRAHVTALRDFVASADRSMAGLPQGIARFLRHVPTEFLLAKRRDEVVRKLDRLLARGPEGAAVPARPPRPARAR